MSDNQSNAGSDAPPEEPPVVVTKEQLTAGLSHIQRTHGKFSDAIY